MTPLERQQQIDRWRARTLGTPTHKQIADADQFPAPNEEYGPVDRFVPLVVAWITGLVLGIALTRLWLGS